MPNIYKNCVSDLGTYRNCSNIGSNFAVVFSFIFSAIKITHLLKFELLNMGCIVILDIPEHQGNTEYS